MAYLSVQGIGSQFGFRKSNRIQEAKTKLELWPAKFQTKLELTKFVYEE